MINAQLALIDVQVSNFTIKASESMMKINEMLSKREYDKARGYAPMVFALLSMYRRSIESYITQSIRKIFETNGEFSFSLDDVQKEKAKIFTWFDEISDQTKEFQKKLESKDDEKIFESLHRVLRKISDEQNLVDLKNTLISLQNEYLVYLMQEDKSELGSLFGSLKFHVTIRKTSEKLFEDGHYAEAIFEACKALVNQVRDKSKLETTRDADLMGRAFSVEYSRNPLQVTKKPVLCLNRLSTLDEIDEQRGFALLFMGMWFGIRDPKAHANVVQKDPYKTLEYLSLISLLAKRTDEAVLSK
jgi:uncharacterized protein (TIGR02391 family)